jgi:2-polyprenyl-6-methoxyphenol hydroxylase-like FAD-dependent oxidoreductase
MSNSQVLIAGAGPTGLVLALCLARHGIRVRIVDTTSGPGQTSRATVVQARTLEFYQQLGFADEVVASGIELENFQLRGNNEDIARIAFKDFGKSVSPFPFVLSFPQDDHERFLIEKLQEAGVSVEWGVELKDFTQDDTHVRAVLDRAGQREICEAAYLCGCDGARSRVRQNLELDFPGGTYSQVFYVADVQIEGGQRRDLSGNLGTNSLALRFPVRSSGMQRLIGIIPQDVAEQTGLSFEDVRPSAEPLLGVHVTQVNWFSTYHVHHRVAAHFRDRRCFIAGDAGHIHSPAGGQGMNTGIGDAVNLSWKLANVLQSKADPALLDTYEAERILFARKLVKSTDRAFRAMIGGGLGNRFLRTWLIPHVMPMLIELPAVSRMMFNTISQVRINYRASDLSAGKAGAVWGGDRLPWVESGDASNFAPLGSLRWQLHLYGEAGSEMSDAAAALGLPIHVFEWSDAAERAGLQRNAAYLVRPDGYVAFATPDQDVAGLEAFVEEWGIRFETQ